MHSAIRMIPWWLNSVPGYSVTENSFDRSRMIPGWWVPFDRPGRIVLYQDTLSPLRGVPVANDLGWQSYCGIPGYSAAGGAMKDACGRPRRFPGWLCHPVMYFLRCSYGFSMNLSGVHKLYMTLLSSQARLEPKNHGLSSLMLHVHVVLLIDSGSYSTCN